MVLCYFTFSLASSYAQTIRIQAQQQALSDVLVELRDNYGIHLSFNHKLLATCIISDSSTYKNAEKAIESLTQQCNLAFELNNNVFLIYQATAPKKTVKPIYYYYSGQLSDPTNTEPLPFSNIQINGKGFISDADGNFSYKSNKPKQQFKFSHLGYYILDTVLAAKSNHKIELTPSVVGLKEVIVHANAQIFNNHIGEQSGLVKLNHKITSFLPGDNNNTLFNLLRLQPGILATAEQSSDYSIWGSYRGQNLIQFDGITLFSASSLNNEIGVINPLIIKDVEVFKAGYNVDKGDRVGGIIQLTGNSGNAKEFTGNINVNNQTLSGILNIPVANKYTLQAALRQSYNSVLNWSDISGNTGLQEETYLPDYDFQDLNLKFSGNTEAGDNFFINFLVNNENSSFSIKQERKQREKAWENFTEKKQYGGAAYYNKKWRKQGNTSMQLSYSSLSTNSIDRINADKSGAGQNQESITFYKQNSISETSFKTEHYFAAKGAHHPQIAATFTQNATTFTEDSVEFSDKHNNDYSNSYGIYIIDKISLGQYFKIQPGLKFNYLPSDNYYFQPRINASITPHHKWKINMAWGKYNQYISEIAHVDELGNRYFAWVINDNNKFPILKAEHTVLGVCYNKNNLKLSVESFYKTTEGISRYINLSNANRIALINFNSRAYGVDFYAEKQFNKHNAWLAYTLSRVQELSNRNNLTSYQEAPQSQTHEIKTAGIFNFDPWYISFNYVYGSGLSFSTNIRDTELTPYNRIDMALLYKFQTNKFNLESGLSVVNVLNTDNIGYARLSNLPEGRSVYSRGIPFTPSIFLNIGF